MEEIKEVVETVESVKSEDVVSSLGDNGEKILFKSKYLDNREVLRKKTPNRTKGKKAPSQRKLVGNKKESFTQYQAKFDRTTYRQYSTKLNGYSEADICWVLDHTDGVKPYIVNLIREDMKRNPKKACYQVPKEIVDQANLIKELKNKGHNYNEAIKIAKS